ncbi:flagellar hook assembly protein FlgD [Polymorphum gilvum]|uniref:Basal-body rod modification protein FlgD n=1 Tax=Polymorphum gilvum (strain LMG 25793 / CGMCC 1.9160 / SL003B-26A1) TaxID=991905 RepID=F2IZL3_POLGS|nr:flagellar hook capping FlgD N-terminal domain-containing protein [Polymorphum gilvum]ADZ69570.1 Flagellar hook capping protein [Polymorphum gilvum SL003B-26A1]
MAEVGSTTSASATTSSSSKSRETLLGSYDLFLTLLTTQIKNQDPLDPLDTAQFTNQLVQYSSVEQSILTNTYLEQLMASVKSGQASGYVSYLGAEVTASGDTAMLESGSASWAYKVSEDATGFVKIRNSDGAVVYEGEVDLAAGSGTYTWDGKTSTGGTAADGAYTISFSVFDGAGKAETVTTKVSGIVDKVDISSGEAFLKIGAVRVPVSSVTSVARVG